jgi:flavin reductase (DIM6/NTAB) family NADH-FMN oxidoreductase RutF/rubredoxin
MDMKALRDISYGVYIIAARDGKKLAGCVANSLIQTSSQPAILAVCINRQNYTNECIKKAGGFSVSILSEKMKGEIIGKFGFQSSKTVDKFEGLQYEIVRGDLPVLTENVSSWISCKLIDSKELITHTMFFGEIVDCKQIGGDPMTYAFYHKVIKGKAPAAAPTYQKEESAQKEENTGKSYWQCKVCGYIYDGSQGKFEDLPEQWKCPICGAGKSEFELKTE